jgi:predicted SnoaL-like aldol condensation-catalyzing enzyme
MMRFKLLAALLVVSWGASAQVPVTGNPNHEKMLQSSDPKLAANKRLVYDFWRTLLEARHVEEAPKYMAEDYIQHNPNIPTGRKPFVAFFSTLPKQELKPQVSRPLVAIVAEGDLVTLAFVHEEEDPRTPGKKYTTTWFDMFRVKDGKIVEHWDGDRIKPPKG